MFIFDLDRSMDLRDLTDMINNNSGITDSAKMNLIKVLDDVIDDNRLFDLLFNSLSNNDSAIDRVVDKILDKLILRSWRTANDKGPVIDWGKAPLSWFTDWK